MTVLLFKSTFLDELILKENNFFIDFTQLNFPQGIHRILNISKFLNNKWETAYLESIFHMTHSFTEAMGFVAGLWKHSKLVVTQ